MTPREVFDLIRRAKGVPVLAHPGITAVDQRLNEFKRDGLLGIEVYHSEHPSAVTQSYMRYAKTHDLAFTGGSDFHSPTHSKSEIGLPKVPYTTVKSLREKLALVT
jgi:predicted metal-dependent phosphoesterase TrpH